MQAQRAIVTLAGPPQLTSTEQWAQIWAGFSAQFPLRNLHWKPATRTSIRTIQSLDVNILALQSFKEEGASQIPSSLLERPLLNLYAVTCEDSDAYKATVKKQIKDWHSQVSSRKCQEWVIILVSKVDGRQSQTGLMRMRGTMLDRIKSDFNVDKRDRCVQLVWTDGFKNPATWAEVMSKSKDGLISAFDQAVSLREEEVKRSELQRTMPGWNFCTFFLLKESLANSFEGANLPEDALIQFDELEASFFQVMKDKTLWFGNFVEPSPKDDSAPLLSLTKKSYRDLILANTISVFDIRVYLLARQCHLLAQMGRITDVAKKASFFLSAFGRRLREFEAILPDCFIESWLYSSALSVVEACDGWAKPLEMDTASQSSYNASKGELLTLARNQLDRIGVRLGRLPNEPPFSSSIVDMGETADGHLNGNTVNRVSRRVSNTDIVGFLDKPASFYELYIRLTNKAIDMFVKAGRRKFALKLHGSLAALDLFRDRNSAAFQTFTSLPAHYAPHRWSSMESFMLFQSIEAHERMQGKSDRQWIHTALALLKAYAEGTSLDLLYGVRNKDVYIQRLCDSVVEAASSLDNDIVLADAPILCVAPLAQTARRAGDKDGYYLDVEITNNFPCTLSVGSISVTLVGKDQFPMEFAAGATIAEPGVSCARLFCPLPIEGAYLVNKAEARIGDHLLLQWSFVPRNKRQHSSTSPETPVSRLVKLPADSQAVKVEIQQPLNVEIAGPSKLSISLSSGRNDLSRALLKVSSADVTLDLKSGCVTKGACSAEFLPESISLSQISTGSSIRLDIPHTRADGRGFVDVTVDLEYSTLSEPGLGRKMAIKRNIPTGLALAVNVQDFFRDESLLTYFTIMTTTNQHIRISSVELEPSDADKESLELSSYYGTDHKITVTRHEPASFIFRLKPRREVNDALRLRITYRLLREEVKNVVLQRIKGLLTKQEADETAISELIIRSLERDSSWVDVYEMTGEVHVPELTDRDKELQPDVTARVREALRESPTTIEDGGEWRQFTIPVDFPRLDILATAHLKIFACPFDKEPIKQLGRTPIYTGQPVTATVSIHTSFQWAGRERKGSLSYRIHYELEENIKDWLLSGQKRGDFMAKDDTTHTISVTLMALRHGEIPLPDVRLLAFHLEGDGNSSGPPTLETYQVHGAERLLVLPRSGKTTYFLNVTREQ